MSQVNIWAAVPAEVDRDKGAIKSGREPDRHVGRELAKVLRGALDDIPFKSRGRGAAERRLISVMANLDEWESAIEELEKSGATIMGAWSWEGAQLKKPHPHLIDYLPDEYEPDEKGDPQLKPARLHDVNLVWGQGERDFG